MTKFWLGRGSFRPQTMTYLKNHLEQRPSTPLEFKKCLENAPHNVGLYSDYIQRETAFRNELDDWIYMGLVIDRLLLCIFSVGFIVSSVLILGKYFDEEWLV